MTPEEFFAEFVGLYRKARVPTFEHSAILRNRCRSVSGGLEDLVAVYVAKNCKGAFKIFVDQHLNLGGKPVMYPDLVLLSTKNNSVEHFIDVKTDLGWKRDQLENICTRFRDQAVRATGVNVSLEDHLGNKGNYAVSRNVRCHLVIGTHVNSGDLAPKKVDAIAKKTGVAIYVFSNVKHPNLFSRTQTEMYPGQYIDRVQMDGFLSALRETQPFMESPTKARN